MPRIRREELVLFTADFVMGDIRINLGIGHGITPASDGTVLKVVTSIPLK